MATKSNIGKTIYYSATLPATNDAAGYEALTWTKIEYPVSAPQFGYTHETIDIPDLTTGRRNGVKGAGTGADSQMAFRIDSGALTTAQAAVKTIADSPQGQIALKIGRGSGAGAALQTGDPVQYAQGFVHSYIENEMTDATYEGFSVSFRQNDLTVVDTEPA